MGLLEVDSLDTVPYIESKRFQRKLKKTGIIQLLHLFKKNQNETKDFKRYPKFGFEIEGHLLQKIARGQELPINYQLQLDKHYLVEKHKNFNVADEYGRWMVELVPLSPHEDFLYSGNLSFYTTNLYKRIEELVKPAHTFLSLPICPKLGTPLYMDFLEPGITPEQLVEANKFSKSSFMRDDFVNTHPRFPAFTEAIRSRRGENPVIEAPIYPDENSMLDLVRPGDKRPGHIYLDAITFGMGLCSLQVTFGVANLDQARWLYDQFHLFTPIFVIH